ncbi:NEK1 [Symbiodinium natans]|uniref:non-specific serine/threonine protein kinase n=1 Tax=Symbiodinium natans TaxID=878477 RepID=A0A812RJ37_9DINO|nr:NEK1 [Symbiodinium natans]
MDFCEGGELARQIRRARRNHQRIPEEQILRWFTQATLAVKFIHDKHILHRDLKPANFFLTKNGSLKMGDFGIAKTMACTMACAKTRIGTPYYLSPEVCQEKPYNWSSDMWSMGCILYEMCALQVPFDAHSISGLVQKICYGPLPLVPDCYSDFLRRLCRQLLDREPKKRPSADEAIYMLAGTCYIQAHLLDVDMMPPPKMSWLSPTRLRKERCLVLLVLGTVLFNAMPAGDDDVHRGPGWTFAQGQRRATIAALAASLSLPGPAQAGLPLMSFTSGGWVEYTVGGAFKVSMPDNYKVLEETSTKVVWQGDRTGQYNTMSAEVKVVDADTLDKALGMAGLSIKDIGEKLSDKRPLNGADFYGEAKLEGVEGYRFEFVGDSIHEYVLHALVRKGSSNLLCTVTTRAAGLLWSNNNRYQTFEKIIASFTPQERAAKGTAGVAGAYRKDDLAEYYSVTHGEWLPAIVTDSDALGRVMIDLRPGVWLSPDVQATKMRSRRREGSSDSSGSEEPRPEKVSEEDAHGIVGEVSIVPAPAEQLKKLPNGRRRAVGVALRLRESPRPPEEPRVLRCHEANYDQLDKLLGQEKARPVGRSPSERASEGCDKG